MNTRNDDPSYIHINERTRDRTPTEEPAADPWPVDITGHDDLPCSCTPPAAKEPKPPCTRSIPKKDDCCESILELLGPKSRTTSRRKVYKPKTPTKVKLANWCCDWPIQDSLGPIMVLLFQRAKKGLTPQNDFEKGMYSFFETLEARHRNALQVGVDAYLDIPETRRCTLETRFDDWADDRPVEADFITKVLLHEIVALGRNSLFHEPSGAPSAGQIRLWDQAIGPMINENQRAIVKAPWPWICAVNPGADNVKWYRNRDTVFPDKSDINSIKFDLHEFSITCSASTDPANPKSISVDCKDNVPTNGFAVCDGGSDYNYTESGAGRFRCLTIPQCVAGQGIALRGFNYSSLKSTVVIKKVGGGFPDMTVACDVMGDDKPPTKDASCTVRDVVTFTLPRTIRDGQNDRPVPPGRYTIEVHVPNETNYAPSPGPAPAEFVSNTALIEVIPPLDIPYQVWVERGNCYEETDGLGDDEPWFRSYTATYRATGSQVIEAKEGDIFRHEDVESGDWIGFPPVTPFSGRLDAAGCVAIAILGLEVDSDDAAEEQITSFGEAYGLFWKQAFTLLSAGAAGGVLGKGIASLIGGAGITASLIVGGIALIVIAAIGLFFADWAPADPIAYDLIVYDAVSLNKLTTPGAALPPRDVGMIGYIGWSTYPKGVTPTSATTADYREERQYWAQDEGSKYGLDFKINQLPT